MSSDPMFEVFFVAESAGAPFAANTKILYIYPPDYAAAEVPKLFEFCFPEVTEKSEFAATLVFTRTDERGKASNGYCLRSYREGSPRRVLCLVSTLFWHKFFSSFLLIAQRSYNAGGAASLEPLMAMRASTPPAGAPITLHAASQRYDLRVPLYDRHLAIDAPLQGFLHSFGPSGCLTLLAAALREYTIVFVSGSVGPASCMAHALYSLLYPFNWGGLLVPVLNMRLVPLLASPVPLICGLARELVRNTSDVPLGDHLVVADEMTGNISLSAKDTLRGKPPLWTAPHAVLSRVASKLKEGKPFDSEAMTGAITAWMLALFGRWPVSIDAAMALKALHRSEGEDIDISDSMDLHRLFEHIISEGESTSIDSSSATLSEAAPKPTACSPRVSEVFGTGEYSAFLAEVASTQLFATWRDSMVQLTVDRVAGGELPRDTFVLRSIEMHGDPITGGATEQPDAMGKKEKGKSGWSTWKKKMSDLTARAAKSVSSGTSKWAASASKALGTRQKDMMKAVLSSMNDPAGAAGAKSRKYWAPDPGVVPLENFQELHATLMIENVILEDDTLSRALYESIVTQYDNQLVHVRSLSFNSVSQSDRPPSPPPSPPTVSVADAFGDGTGDPFFDTTAAIGTTESKPPSSNPATSTSGFEGAFGQDSDDPFWSAPPASVPTPAPTAGIPTAVSSLEDLFK